MKKTIMNRMDGANLSPSAYAALMLECTDENGVLSIPEYHFTDELTEGDETAERFFEMDWNAEKLQELAERFETLYGDIRSIAETCLSAGCDPLHDAQIPALETDRQADVWRTYIREYEFRGISPDTLSAIEKCLRAELGEEEPTAEEKALCDRFYDSYWEAMEEEAAKRLGGGIFDVAVILRARRICALMTLRAPEIILENEAQRLIEALALTRFAKREIRK
ncbi:MAG: hypothetical protein J1E00_06245 [Oscillospiraceae bacterium]|nr:hypothetical protein [Oscillospiraceae bacterium]